MIKFTTILHDKREELDISMLEYVVLDTIEKLSRPKFRAHRKTLADFIGMSRQGLIKAINRLVEKGLLIRVNDKEIAVTQRWIDETIASKEVSTKCTPSVNKVDSKCKQSLQPTSNRIKELESIEEILEYLNKKTGKSFKVANGLKSRFKEGYTVEDVKKVIDIKFDEWSKDPAMSQYLTPDTLFSNKFDKYLNQGSTSSAKFDPTTWNPH